MTDLETVQRAKMYMDQLSQGIDPISGKVIPVDSALNNPRLARCFSYVAGILEQVVQNGGHVGAVEKVEFSISPEQLANIVPSETPVFISEFADRILQATGNTTMKRPNVVKINNWLEKQGFLTKESTADGKSRRVPTAAGQSIGITGQMRQARDGDYLALYYDANAQRFLLQHLLTILQDS